MSKTVIVVDDSASMRQVVAGTLESAGFATMHKLSMGLMPWRNSINNASI
jgi:FixJ family two-component response regulator